jgi:hypothetical protein
VELISIKSRQLSPHQIDDRLHMRRTLRGHVHVTRERFNPGMLHGEVGRPDLKHQFDRIGITGSLGRPDGGALCFPALL